MIFCNYWSLRRRKDVSVYVGVGYRNVALLLAAEPHTCTFKSTNVCVCVCMHACVRACVRACVCVSVYTLLLLQEIYWLPLAYHCYNKERIFPLWYFDGSLLEYHFKIFQISRCCTSFVLLTEGRKHHLISARKHSFCFDSATCPQKVHCSSTPWIFLLYQNSDYDSEHACFDEPWLTNLRCCEISSTPCVCVCVCVCLWERGRERESLCIHILAISLFLPPTSLSLFLSLSLSLSLSFFLHLPFCFSLPLSLSPPPCLLSLSLSLY